MWLNTVVVTFLCATPPNYTGLSCDSHVTFLNHHLLTTWDRPCLGQSERHCGKPLVEQQGRRSHCWCVAFTAFRGSPAGTGRTHQLQSAHGFPVWGRVMWSSHDHHMTIRLPPKPCTQLTLHVCGHANHTLCIWQFYCHTSSPGHLVSLFQKGGVRCLLPLQIGSIAPDKEGRCTSHMTYSYRTCSWELDKVTILERSNVHMSHSNLADSQHKI